MLRDLGDRLADLRFGRGVWALLALLAIVAGGVLGTVLARALSGQHAAARAATAPPPSTAAAPPPPPPATVTVVVQVRKITVPAPTPATPRPTPHAGGLPYATLALPPPTPAGANRVLRELQQLPQTRMQAFEYTTHIGVARRVVILYPRVLGNRPLPLVLAIH